MSLRYFNVAGASGGRGERHDPETHLIPLVLDVAAGRRESVQVFGTDYPTPDGSGFSVREVVRTAEQVTGRPIPTVDSPRRAGDPPVLVAAGVRIAADLGWRPRIPELADIISDAWEFARG